MGTAEYQWFKVKFVNPVFVMATDTMLHGYICDNIVRILGLDMNTAGAMAHFTTGIFQSGGLSF